MSKEALVLVAVGSVGLFMSYATGVDQADSARYPSAFSASANAAPSTIYVTNAVLGDDYEVVTPLPPKPQSDGKR